MSEINWAALAEPFSADTIKWKPEVTTKGKDKQPIMRNGQQVAGCTAHIDARIVMARLDEVVGPANWSDSYRVVKSDKSVNVECTLTICGVSKTDVGQSNDGGFADAYKSAYSDAFKRAAVKFGIGRHLYDMDMEWLPFDGYRIIEQPKPQRAPKPASNGKRQPVAKPAPAPRNNAVKEIMALVDGLGVDLMEGAETVHPKYGDVDTSGMDSMFAKSYGEFTPAFAAEHPYYTSAQHVWNTLQIIFKERYAGQVPPFAEVKGELAGWLEAHAAKAADLEAV